MSLSVEIHSHCGFKHGKALILLVNVAILDWGSSSALNWQLISLYLIFYTIQTSAYNFYPTQFLHAQKLVLPNNFIVHPCDGILARKLSHTSSLHKKTRLENTGMKKLWKKPTIHELNNCEETKEGETFSWGTSTRSSWWGESMEQIDRHWTFSKYRENKSVNASRKKRKGPYRNLAMINHSLPSYNKGI